MTASGPAPVGTPKAGGVYPAPVRPSPIVFLVILAACDSPFTPPPPTVGTPTDAPKTLTLRPDSANLFADDTLQMLATVKDSAGQPLVMTVTWSVDDSNVVTIDPNGRAIAVDSGATMVRVSTAGLKDSTRIRVVRTVYRSIASGGTHSCAIGTNHRVYCWGADHDGQLGVKPQVLERPAPTAIAAGAVFQTIAAGTAHTCGSGTDFEMRCWGDNTFGQLGLGTTGGTSFPATATAPFDFVLVTAGGDHTCALTATHVAECWGRNSSGELGVGDTSSRNVPTLTAEGRTVTAIATGASHTCAETSTGAVLCWGANAAGQLGDSSTTGRTAPDSVRTSVAFDQLAAGGNHTCGLSSGVAYCWGSNQRGESGTGATDSALVAPLAVSGPSFTALTLGSDFTCGLAINGSAYCWGANDSGQVGDSTQTDRSTPTPVQGGQHFTAIAAGASHVCAMTADGHVYCWGEGTSGQLGLAVPVPLKTTPTLIPLPN